MQEVRPHHRHMGLLMVDITAQTKQAAGLVARVRGLLACDFRYVMRPEQLQDRRGGVLLVGYDAPWQVIAIAIERDIERVYVKT